MLVPLLPLIRSDFGLNYFQSGLLVSSFNVTYGISQIPLGRLADRANKPLLLALGLWGVAFTAMAVGLSPGYYIAIASFIAMGVLGGTYHPSSVPLLSQFYSRERRGQALGFHFIGGNASFLLTPVLSGLIAQMAGWRTAFIAMPLFTLLSTLVFVAIMKGQGLTASEVAARAEAKERVPLGEVVRVLGVLVGISGFTALITSGVNSFLPLYLVDKHGVAPSLAAMMIGLTSGAGVVGGPAGGALSDRIGRKPVIMTSIILVGPLLYLLTVAPFGPGLIAAFLLFGLAQTSRMPAMESLIMDVVPAQQRSTVFGFYFFLTTEMGGIASTAVGLLIDWMGLNTVFTLLALTAVASSSLLLLIRGKL